MNYVYLVATDKYCNKSELLLRTLDEHCRCVVLLNIYDAPEGFADNVSKWFKQDYIIFNMTADEWVDKRLSCKINRLLKMNFQYGDHVVGIDIDTMVQVDIFEDVFNKDFDVFYTTRFEECQQPINSGFWGFRFNEAGEKFVEFYASQTRNPTWRPFMDFQNKFMPIRTRYSAGPQDWWCDQDFLNAVYLNGGVPFECNIIDLGYKYNCYRIDDKVPQITPLENLVGNKEYRVLHFKGRERSMEIVLNKIKKNL